MKINLCSIVIIQLLSISLLFSDSIWDDKAGNIYNRKIYYTPGDAVQILIDENTALEYKSSAKSLKSYQLNLSGGGEITGLFSFVPTGNVEESTNSQDKDTLKIQMIIPARIIRVNNNFITVRGIKQIQLNNKTSVLEITGDAALADINGNKIASNQLIDPIIRITTLLENNRQVINEQDLIKIILNPDSTGDKIEATQFSEDKKKAMLLEYFNKILNVIF